MIKRELNSKILLSLKAINKKNFRDYVILIFGDGELKQQLQNLIRQHHSVKFIFTMVTLKDLSWP